MASMRIVTIESHHLADGGHAVVSRTGRTYMFARSYNSLTRPPAVRLNLTKAAALALLAYIIRADVLELEDEMG